MRSSDGRNQYEGRSLNDFFFTPTRNDSASPRIRPILFAIIAGMEETHADWKGIVEIAVETDAKLGRQCSKPGQRMRHIYWSSYRDACAIGYHGSERDWESFVRVRAAATR